MTDQNGTERDDETEAVQPEATAAEENGQPEASDAGLSVEDALRQEVAETTDRLKRALAETENVRRRAEKEREDTAKFAISKFARDIVNVADNLRRALESVPPDTDDPAVKTLVEGIELTERELLSAFDRHGIVKIDPTGEKFDHQYHEAMFEVPTNDAPPGTVVQVMEVGYVLNDRLLRPARVGIAKALPDTADSGHVDTTA